jgi:hypothetical protein
MTFRPALLAAAAFAAAFGTFLVLSRWGAGGNRDLAAIARGVQRGEELDSLFELRWRQNVARRVVAAEVVAGRMSLREAADHFRRLDEAGPGGRPGLPRPLRDERALRADVLSHVWVVLAHEGRFAAAARWYAVAFTAHPDVLAGPLTRHRYYAACAAARAGCGQGRDAAELDEESRADFRHQALGWLRAELEARQRLLEQEPANSPWLVGGELHGWLGDPGFAGLRGPEALAWLPEAERQAWQKFWADVADTLARAVGRIPPEPKAGGKIPLPER